MLLMLNWQIGLAQREIMLHDMIRCTRESLEFDYDTFIVQKHEEELLEILPTTPSPLEPLNEFAERFSEYIGFYDKEGRVPSHPFGVLLSQEGMLNGQYLEKYIFSRATQYTPHSQLYKKPEGKYAVLAHKGTIKTHLQSFSGMLDKISSMGLSIIGNGYAYDMMSTALFGSGEFHSSKYCILVE